MQLKIAKAFEAMRDLEGGAIANPTEKRMVGLSNGCGIRRWRQTRNFAQRSKKRSSTSKDLRRIFTPEKSPPKMANASSIFFSIGIGGSALGPQFVADALGSRRDPMDIYFFDNTDSDGFNRVFDKIENYLSQTLVIVVSKSGGTKETRNGMLEAEAKFKEKGLEFPKHAVAVTGVGSELDKFAENNEWLARFTIHDWIGGRTSVMSAVGLLPMALEGFDINNFLVGATAMDERTRMPDAAQNAAILLALAWYHAGDGKGEKDMVILPYKDRLALFSRYLQQLVMESLGKEKDLDGKIVHQGIAVYGNKA